MAHLSDAPILLKARAADPIDVHMSRLSLDEAHSFLRFVLEVSRDAA